MAEKKIEINERNASNTGWDTIYPKTSADVVFTDEGTTVQNEIDNLKLSVSNGKNQIATAITDKGGSASGSDTFSQLASAIGNITTGMKYASGSLNVYVPFGKNIQTISQYGLDFNPSIVIVNCLGASDISYTQYSVAWKTDNPNHLNGMVTYQYWSDGVIKPGNYVFAENSFEIDVFSSYSNGTYKFEWIAFGE